MKNFFKTIHCSSRVHCETCQDKGARGRKWRKSLSLNIDGIDCPPHMKCDHVFKATGKTSKPRSCKSCGGMAKEKNYVFEHLVCEKCGFNTKRRVNK